VKPRPVHTHFVDFDQPGTRSARTLCNILIDRREAVSTPTCERCRDLLLYRDRIVEDLQRGVITGVEHAGGCQCRACFDAWFKNRARPHG